MAGKLIEAVVGLRFREVKMLLDCGVKADCRTVEGKTPLISLCYVDEQRRREKMFDYLIKRGGNLLELDKTNNKTLLHYACELRRADIVRKILDTVGGGSVDVNGRDARHKTPLIYAVCSGSIEIVEMVVGELKRYGISVDTPDLEGFTPLLLAQKYGHREIADILRNDGEANPCMRDDKEFRNAQEWGNLSSSLKRDVNKQTRSKQRENQLIFPPINHARSRREKTIKQQQPGNPVSNLETLSKASSSSKPLAKNNKAGSLELRKKAALKSAAAYSLPSMPAVGDADSSSLYSHITSYASDRMKAASATNKSLDSALSLLELAAKSRDKVQHATSFVSSEFDLSKSEEYPGLSPQANIITHMMDSYSAQYSSSFRKTVKFIPKKVEPIMEKRHSNVSTLSIIFGHDRRNLRSRRRSRATKTRQGSRPSSRARAPSRQGGNQSNGKGPTGKEGGGVRKLPSGKLLEVGNGDLRPKSNPEEGRKVGEGQSEQFLSTKNIKMRTKSTGNRDLDLIKESNEETAPAPAANDYTLPAIMVGESL